MAQNTAAAAGSGRFLAPVWKRRLKTAWRLISSVIVTLLGLLALTFFIGRLLPIGRYAVFGNAKTVSGSAAFLATAGLVAARASA